MRALHEGELSIEASMFPGRLRLDWSGRSVHRDPARILHPYLSEVFQIVEQAGVTLEMHFEKLVQFNSSTIAVVVQFLALARMRNLSLNLVYDARARWQAMSFDALKRALLVNDGRPGRISIVPADGATAAPAARHG